jgi:hypothetical protein
MRFFIKFMLAASVAILASQGGLAEVMTSYVQSIMR